MENDFPQEAIPPTILLVIWMAVAITICAWQIPTTVIFNIIFGLAFIAGITWLIISLATGKSENDDHRGDSTLA